MNIIPNIFYPLLGGVVIFVYTFFKYPRFAIAALIIAKPIIDLTRYYYVIPNINFLKIYAGLYVILGVIYILWHRPNILRHPVSIVWLNFLSMNVVSFFLISHVDPVDKLKSFLAVFTGFISLILFASLFTYQKDRVFVISLFIIASIFPLLLWLIPVILGNPIVSDDELRRIIGPYHGFMHFNFYALQMIVCVFTYLSITNKYQVKPTISEKTRNFSFIYEHRFFFLKRASRAVNHLITKYKRVFNSIKRVILYLAILISVAMVYKCYSKIGWITLVVIFFVWFLLKKKYLLVALVFIVSLLTIFINPFARDFQKTFSNELDYYVYGLDIKEKVFRGRLEIWESMIDSFTRLPFMNKLFGAKRPMDNPANDYLRVLWNNGLLGFFSYLALLGVTAYFLIRKFIGEGEEVSLMGFSDIYYKRYRFKHNDDSKIPVVYVGNSWIRYFQTPMISSLLYVTIDFIFSFQDTSKFSILNVELTYLDI